MLGFVPLNTLAPTKLKVLAENLIQKQLALGVKCVVTATGKVRELCRAMQV